MKRPLKISKAMSLNVSVCKSGKCSDMWCVGLRLTFVLNFQVTPALGPVAVMPVWSEEESDSQIPQTVRPLT